MDIMNAMRFFYPEQYALLFQQKQTRHNNKSLLDQSIQATACVIDYYQKLNYVVKEIRVNDMEA